MDCMENGKDLKPTRVEEMKRYLIVKDQLKRGRKRL